MHNFFRTIFIFLCLSTIPLPGHAQGSDLAGQLIIKSGLVAQLAEIPGQIQLQMQQRQQAGTDPQELATASRILKEAYAPKKLSENAKSHLAQALTEEDIRGVLEWLDSPLGMKITALEEKAATPESQVKMQEQAEALFGDEERLALVQQLNLTIDATAGMMKMVENMALTAALAGDCDISQDEVRVQVQEGMLAQRDIYQLSVLLSMLYSYQTLSAEELNSYIAFAGSKLGLKYHRIMMEAVDRAVSKATTEMVELMKAEESEL